MLARRARRPEPATTDALELRMDEHGNVAAEQYLTSAPGVFVAGDARVGASLVVTAIDEGRKCAEAVHAYLASGSTGDVCRTPTSARPPRGR